MKPIPLVYLDPAKHGPIRLSVLGRDLGTEREAGEQAVLAHLFVDRQVDRLRFLPVERLVVGVLVKPSSRSLRSGPPTKRGVSLRSQQPPHSALADTHLAQLLV